MKKRSKIWSIGALGLAGAIMLSGCTSSKEAFIFEHEKGSMTKDELIDELRVSVGDTVLKQAIGSKILLEFYEVDDKLVEARYAQLEKEFSGDGGIEAQIDAMGMSVEKFKDQLRVEEAHQLALRDMNKVSEEDVLKVFEENNKGIGVIQFMSSDKQELAKVRAALEEGKTFSEISKETDENKGLLSDVTLVEYLSPEYLKEVFTAKEGDVLEIEVAAGTLLVLVGKEENVEFEAVKGEIENRLMYADVKSFDDVLAFLIERHNIKLDKKYKELIKESVDTEDKEIDEKLDEAKEAETEKLDAEIERSKEDKEDK